MATQIHFSEEGSKKSMEGGIKIATELVKNVAGGLAALLGGGDDSDDDEVFDLPANLTGRNLEMKMPVGMMKMKTKKVRRRKRLVIINLRIKPMKKVSYFLSNITQKASKKRKLEADDSERPSKKAKTADDEIESSDEDFQESSVSQEEENKSSASEDFEEVEEDEKSESVEETEEKERIAKVMFRYRENKLI